MSFTFIILFLNFFLFLDKTDAYKTRAEQKQIPEDREKFTEGDLLKLPELHPPDIMPNGNVGTPTMEFLKLIRECRLPPVVIKKLGLSFPKTRTNKKYGNVPFDYGGDTFSGSNEEEEFEVWSGSGHKICDSIDNVIDLELTEKGHNTKIGDVKSNSEKINRKWRKDPETKQLMRENIEEKMIKNDNSDSEEDNDSCEEWERHEALCDDPSNQERNKERLFEEEIELKWEKGGSGLVFYTDAQYWQEQEGDFDEQTTDDWDVDMSAYYEEGAGDKDIRDFITMRQEQRRREGIEDTDRFTAKIAVKRPNRLKPMDSGTKIGKFEKYTKGIGRKILEEQGWKEGLGLGSSSHGISDALESEGQHSKDKTGFGFRGEKLLKHKVKNRNSQRDVIISTVYDDEKQTDPNEPLLRRHNHYTLKYRDKVEFTKAKSSE